MTRLKVPSLQHLARNWRDTPEQISDELIRLAKRPPNFSYAQLNGLVTDLLVLKQPLDEVIKAANRVKRDSVRQNFLELLPLIDNYFQCVSPDFIQSVGGRLFPIGRGLMVPFNPPLVYGSRGQLCFPWFSYWRSNPLSGRNLSLFVTSVDEVLRQDPDLDEVAFHILDFSAPIQGQPRTLKVLDSRSIPRLTQEDLESKLSVFAEGFALAKHRLSLDESATEPQHNQPSQSADDGQADLFS